MSDFITRVLYQDYGWYYIFPLWYYYIFFLSWSSSGLW